MFNSGHHAQTAALYMKAGNEVLGQMLIICLLKCCEYNQNCHAQSEG
jgi:hypothetical protein